jgi:hypothetical protein
MNLGMGMGSPGPSMAASDPNGVDAAWYLQTYPDVAQAIQQGTVRTPAEHYSMFGKAEGRQPNAQAATATQVPAGPPPPPPFRPGGQDGKAPMANGQAAPDWVTAARQATAGMNAMPFVLNPQMLSGSDQMANGRLLFPRASQFAKPTASNQGNYSGLPSGQGNYSGTPASSLLGDPAAQQQAEQNALLAQLLYQAPGQGGN